MEERFSRTALLLGQEALQKLSSCRVALFGLGGVGSYIAEALARSGIGAIDIIDSDKVSVSNINRQLCALDSTVGRYKTDVVKERILDINPNCKVTAHNIFFTPETADSFDFSSYDYVADAVDTVTAKLTIITLAKAADTPVISCMGTGNKTDPTALEVADIYETSVCPLARTMRYECRKRGIDSLKVVYSKEPPRTPLEIITENGKTIPASLPFVPSAAGLIIAGEIIKDLADLNK